MPEIKLAVATQRINMLSRYTISYNRVLQAVLNGAIPARLNGGRWMVAEDDLPAAAEYLSRGSRLPPKQALER
jgi:hypothetical protein